VEAISGATLVVQGRGAYNVGHEQLNLPLRHQIVCASQRRATERFSTSVQCLTNDCLDRVREVVGSNPAAPTWVLMQALRLPCRRAFLLQFPAILVVSTPIQICDVLSGLFFATRHSPCRNSVFGRLNVPAAVTT
jgi:hypothetical protein